MTPDQIITDVETVAGELARLRIEMARVVGRLADSELQLQDVRAERDQEHQLAETLKVTLADSERLAETLKAAFENSAAIEEAIGIVAAKAGVGIPEARARLKSYSRDHRQEMSAVALSIIARQDPASPGHGDPEVERVIATAGIPLSFWNALTLNGAIFK